MAEVNKILKCFCGCTNLTKDDIKSITMMRAGHILENPMAKNLFFNFLRIGHSNPNDKSRAQEELECYDLCKDLRQNPAHRIDKTIDQLVEYCPNYQWEEELIDLYSRYSDDSGSDELEQFFERLMSENRKKIESHPDYRRFHQNLLEKLS